MIDFADPYLMTIGGKSVGADRQLEAFNPATKEVIASFPEARREQLDEAVRSAREAFGVWSGPILPLLKWSDEEDVTQRANDTRYGLGASVWGRDQEAVQRIGSRLDAGTVWLNEIHQYSPHQAFGGHKESGIGCENSLHGLMEYTNWHTITLNKSWGS